MKAILAILAALCVSCNSPPVPMAGDRVRSPLAIGYVVTDCDGQSFYVSPELARKLHRP